jgi:hypothetical protein
MSNRKRKGPGDVASQVQRLSIRQRKQEPGRDRGWEERQRNDPETRQVTYRGIPRPLHDSIKELAQTHDLTISEVARWLLEWGLEELESERRELPQNRPFKAVPQAARNTNRNK